jgi:heptaprenyl diphosphate synthase
MTLPYPAIPPDVIVDIQRVESLIAERLRGRPLVAQIAAPHTTFVEAQRLRIALVLLAAQIGSYQFERTAHAATAVGLIMAASSLHGGLVDPTARRQDAVPAWLGIEVNAPLMVGDYLFALAAAEMALAPDPRIIAYYSRSVMVFCEATLAPVEADQAPEALAQHQSSIAHSAATLVESACRAGGVCGGLDQAQIDTLGRYGYDLGRAWLIRDEIAHLDRTLPAGIITTPLIYAAEAAGSHISTLIAQHPDNLLATVKQLGGDARANSEAQRYASLARAQLASLPGGSAKKILDSFT